MEEDQENTKMFITTEIKKKEDKGDNGRKTSRFEGKNVRIENFFSLPLLVLMSSF